MNMKQFEKVLEGNLPEIKEMQKKLMDEENGFVKLFEEGEHEQRQGN